MDANAAFGWRCRFLDCDESEGVRAPFDGELAERPFRSLRTRCKIALDPGIRCAASRMTTVVAPSCAPIRVIRTGTSSAGVVVVEFVERLHSTNNQQAALNCSFT
ncbi:hypothetical protein C7S18_22490 [Ahniella affigens]|uniref:Uncharacterized protein n=1 Tax=Ahniella affigens TaxID=2021234 RepID=A0A2P1PY46_9GAMM|nr:hypothetical protein C7S18_22490 [Ahniella affigens]